MRGKERDIRETFSLFSAFVSFSHSLWLLHSRLDLLKASWCFSVPTQHISKQKFKVLWNIKNEAGTWNRARGNRQHEDEGLRGNHKHLHKQTHKFVQRNPSAQRPHALTVGYNIYSSNIFCTRYFYIFISSPCFSSTWKWFYPLSVYQADLDYMWQEESPNYCCLMWRKAAMRSSLTTISITSSVGHAVQKQGRSLSIKTRNHTVWHYVTEGMLLFTLFIPLFPLLWCLLAVYASWCLHVSGKPIKS